MTQRIPGFVNRPIRRFGRFVNRRALIAVAIALSGCATSKPVSNVPLFADIEILDYRCRAGRIEAVEMRAVPGMLPNVIRLTFKPTACDGDV